MIQTDRGAEADGEWCESCAVQTPHDVSIELRTESEKDNNAKFSREPYRITQCQMCGETTSQRMNNV
ncbi:hypothetical protein DMJ13_26145 [halophilic archaeon]|nr:hypothetical protein DMJ13_26145 [halophilic archaeon]